jgi:glycosyltransferase involved in cell wall biosynthesis
VLFRSKPIVQYDLKEGRVSAQGASLYASNDDTRDFANKISWLLDNEATRKDMGEYGYQRIINELSWDYEKNKLVDFYKKVLKTKTVAKTGTGTENKTETAPRKLKPAPEYIS